MKIEAAQAEEIGKKVKIEAWSREEYENRSCSSRGNRKKARNKGVKQGEI
jgi:hypothetical protein